jgi:hypothetical protein
MFNIDDWFPNFHFFVIIITPILIAIFFIAILLSRWIKIKWPIPSPYQQKLAFYIGFAPVIYMLWPLYDIIQYIMGTQTTIIAKLFTVHLPWLMCIIVLTGLGQVVCYTFGAKYHDGGS